MVTINDVAEYDWIYSTELGSAHRWIGFTDAAQEGDWVWISGEPVTYTRWLPGEPNNLSGIEDYTEMDRNGWNDVPNDGWGVPHQGIVEVAAEDVPTVSEWGMVTMTLLLLTAGTLVFMPLRVALDASLSGGGQRTT